MLGLRRCHRIILRYYRLYQKKILAGLLASCFLISFFSLVFDLEKTNISETLVWIYAIFMFVVATRFALFIYRKVPLLLRFVYLAFSLYLIFNHDFLGDINNIFSNFVNDILNLIVFVAGALLMIAVIDFINDFIKWFLSISNKKQKFVLLFKASTFIFVVATCVYTIFSIRVINSRLMVIEKRFGGSSKVGCSESESIDRLKGSVVRVVGGESEGSGFAIKENLIMTNFHVIKFEPSPKVVFADNTFETAEIKYADKRADLAILAIKRPLKAIVWGDSDRVELTEELIALGYPFGGSLIGDLSVNTGKMSAKRLSREDAIEYIQIDGTLNSGVSGGPLINVCGEVVGVNTAGTAGLGLAISAKSAQQKWALMLSNEDPLADVEKIEFEPNRSSLDAVTSFYNYLKIRKMKKAFALLSENFTKDGGFANWKIGYESLLDTTVIKIKEDPNKENIVNVKLSTKDLLGEEIVYKYFEGWWEVKEIDGRLKLWQAKIKEVRNPSWLWFWKDNF